MGINEGENALGFELHANDDTTVNLESFKEKKNVVLSFYTKKTYRSIKLYEDSVVGLYEFIEVAISG